MDKIEKMKIPPNSETTGEAPVATLSYKDIILARYTGEFLQATEETTTIQKSSAQIVLDLRPLAEFSTNEIAECLIRLGYTIGFNDACPVWLLRQDPGRKLNE